MSLFLNVLSLLQSIAFLQGLLQKLLEGDLEIEIYGPATRSLRPSKSLTSLKFRHEESPILSVNVGNGKFISGWFDAVFINNSRNYAKRIIGAEMHLKRPFLR